jgi:hypothetical protein
VQSWVSTSKRWVKPLAPRHDRCSAHATCTGHGYQALGIGGAIKQQVSQHTHQSHGT